MPGLFPGAPVAVRAHHDHFQVGFFRGEASHKVLLVERGQELVDLGHAADAEVAGERRDQHGEAESDEDLGPGLHFRKHAILLS